LIEGGECCDVLAAGAAMRCCRGYIGARLWLTEANATVTGVPPASADPHLYVGFATLRAATLFGAASCALHKVLFWRSWRE
jgi:hypothetical protein